MKKNKIDLLIQHARKTIEAKLKGISYTAPMLLLNDEELKEKRGTFVTITTKEGSLRGCIGHIEPVMTIFDGVTSNSIQAAFHDPRFLPLEPSELGNIKIEVSILSNPKEIVYSTPGEFVTSIIPGKHGVIFALNNHVSTFLPQVWEELRELDDFLNHLAVKAGLSPTIWKTNSSLRVYIYDVEKSSE